MYLKSIEVHGFKSFAKKMTFEFHDGITAIVGPNGSGKSNVADAVRWVLGEQSAKQLRGAKMEDVIFAGTQNRKPQGFAYVAITINNADHKLPLDYEEVTIARRVYRSGESEYLLNGANCRLRDVQELLFDTGIGKEGYSIIGQGQIDKILSGKPDERRELFDEAAGIVKLKTEGPGREEPGGGAKQSGPYRGYIVGAGKTGRTPGKAVGEGEGIPGAPGLLKKIGYQCFFDGLRADTQGCGYRGGKYRDCRKGFSRCPG